MSEPSPNDPMVFEWMKTGDQAFATMLNAIDAAQRSVRFETYIFCRGEPGDAFRAALIRAAQRGVYVYALIDAWGSTELPSDYFDPLIAAGAEFRWFNRPKFLKVTFRNHRKLLVCDEQIAFIGGFNIAPEYMGDGIQGGWRDLGMRFEGPLSVALAESFDKMFMRAELKHRAFMRLMRTGAHQRIARPPDGEIIVSGPGRGLSRLRKALTADLRVAKEVRIMAAYFLPTFRLRRRLLRTARKGGKVQLILPGRSDVMLSQLASRRLYTNLLKAGVEIYEYQPQILHAKLINIDNAVYLGSANLDTRSLHINYELSVRFNNPEVAAGAKEAFDASLKHSKRIELKDWRRTRSLGARLKENLAYWLLARLDLYIARRQIMDLR